MRSTIECNKITQRDMNFILSVMKFWFGGEFSFSLLNFLKYYSYIAYAYAYAYACFYKTPKVFNLLYILYHEFFV